MARRVNNAVDQGSFYFEQPSNQPPPFLTKTYDMVDDAGTDDTVSWSSDGRSFVVWKPAEFARDLLPQHFKHNNFSSFVRQLNTYGFRKTDPDRWEFSNDFFVRSRRDLLRGIHRRKTGNAPAPGQPDAQQLVAAVTGNSAIEVGSFGGLSDEVESLRRDKNVLMMELVRLRQQQQASEQEIGKLHDRLERTEQNQRHIMAFLTKAVQEPAFLQQVLGSNPGPQRLTDGDTAGRRKRRATRRGPAGGSPHASDTEREGQLVQYQPKEEFSPQFLEVLDQDRETSPTAATSSQDGQGRLEEVTDVNSAFHNLQLALPNSTPIKEDRPGQQRGPLSRPGSSDSLPVPSIPMQTSPAATPSDDAQDFEAFTANLASMLPGKKSQPQPQKQAAALQQAPRFNSASTTAPLASPWSTPAMQAGPEPSTSYPLPTSASNLQTPDDFAMSLDMLPDGNTSFPGHIPDANGLAPSPSQDPFRDQFWEQWVRDAPDNAGSDADVFNRIPSSIPQASGPEAPESSRT